MSLGITSFQESFRCSGRNTIPVAIRFSFCCGEYSALNSKACLLLSSVFLYSVFGCTSSSEHEQNVAVRDRSVILHIVIECFIITCCLVVYKCSLFILFIFSTRLSASLYISAVIPISRASCSEMSRTYFFLV